MRNFQTLSKFKYLLRSSRKLHNAAYSTETSPMKDTMKSVTNLIDSYAATASEFTLWSKSTTQILNESALSSSANNLLYAFPHQRKMLTYKDVNERVNVAAQNLLDMGFVKGDRLAIILPNINELPIAYFAASQIGLITTILNPAYQIFELEYMLKKSGAKGVIMYDTFKTLNHIGIIREICPELDTSVAGELVSAKLPNLKHVFIIQSPLNTEKKYYKGTWEFSKISETQSSAVSHELPYTELDDPNLILFTSGTTGNPKGALMSQRGLLNGAYLSSSCCGLSEPANVAMPVPFFHIYGFVLGMLDPLVSGQTRSNVFPFFFPDTLSSLKAVEAFKCILMRGTPTQWFDFLNHPERSNHAVDSIKYAVIAGSTVSPDLLANLRNVAKIQEIFVGYGMTETSLVHSLTTLADKHKGPKYAYESCGRGLPYMESKIIDPETGKIQPLNTEGELHVRGFHVFKKYWDEPEKTNQAIDSNGWLKTGDIMSMDEEGYLFFKNRSKDVVIRGGANIYPSEIENYLTTHPDIIAAEAFGVPDERLGEEICAWIILKPGTSMNSDDLKSFCKGKISQFKIPKYVKFVDAYPINANNKVLKGKMQEMAIKELGL